MLDGVIKKFDANFAIAVSGIAGPIGATKISQLVQSNWNLWWQCDKMVDIYKFDGSREEVQIQAAKTSLKEILKFVKSWQLKQFAL